MKKQGFTLLELLVVIGIIALLVSFAAVSYSAAQVRARDARRKADLNAMKDAMEQYYAINNAYPGAGSCSSAQTYLRGTWPSDPGTYSYTQTCSGTAYCICAQMEAGNGGNSSNTSCTGWTTNGAYQCVQNLQ